MADISQEIVAFQSAVYGEDVRTALVNLATKLNTSIEDSTDTIDEYLQDNNINKIENILNFNEASISKTTEYILNDGYEYGYYKSTSSGIIKQTSSSHKCSCVLLPLNVDKISYTIASQPGVMLGFFTDENDTYISMLDSNVGEHTYEIPIKARKVYLNFFAGGILSDGYHLGIKPFLTGSDLNSINDDLNSINDTVYGQDQEIEWVRAPGDGWISSATMIKYRPSQSTSNELMIINDLSAVNLSVGDYVKININYNSSTYGPVGFSQSEITGNVAAFSTIPWKNSEENQTYTFKIPENTAAIAIYNSRDKGNGHIWRKITSGINQNISDIQQALESIQSLTENKYLNCVKKPYDFSQKSIYFFGDSITYGYIAAQGDIPSHQANNQYPKVFSEAVNATYHNYAESGSLIVENHMNYHSIFTRIKAKTLDSDFIFIAGGVNDWQTGVNEESLTNGVENICNYLNENYSGEVIFITPINEAGRITSYPPTQTLANVRNVITRIALKHGYSVVQGYTFPFPTKNDNPQYISLMFQDKLHPTELGYSMYAQALQNALC